MKVIINSAGAVKSTVSSAYRKVNLASSHDVIQEGIHSMELQDKGRMLPYRGIYSEGKGGGGVIHNSH